VDATVGDRGSWPAPARLIISRDIGAEVERASWAMEYGGRAA
jgi:hypothetical protein